VSAVFASAPGTRHRPALELLPKLGFSSEVIEQLSAVSKSLPGEASASAAPALEAALVIVEAFPSTLSRHANLGIPFEVTARTLRDLERRMREYREQHGKWGFDRFAWMQNHVAGSLFEIGRLQFISGQWREAYAVYRGRASGAVWALPMEKASAGADHISGHPADPLTGAISPTPVNLPPGSRLAATKGDAVLHVHIPSGPGFTATTCAQSLREARRFFTRYFPDAGFKAICCRTWLLDPALREIMPAKSNILGLGRLFRLLPVPGADDRQHLERIFGSEVDWKTCVPQTQLQKAAQDFLARGGKFHLTAGYLLWDDPHLTGTKKEKIGEND